ncbi:hypothetical protein M5K25_026603 [Dendrobium thyrsiflorum]|uniref:protein-S-isoprenylcysteine alpha-carbonyl methylesterase n=1 Tax=Dendrobium thyrsiflorum TaxID=117978 RepID=A0ABD0TXQ4_DENTH
MKDKIKGISSALPILKQEYRINSRLQWNQSCLLRSNLGSIFAFHRRKGEMLQKRLRLHPFHLLQWRRTLAMRYPCSGDCHLLAEGGGQLANPKLPASPCHPHDAVPSAGTLATPPPRPISLPDSPSSSSVILGYRWITKFLALVFYAILLMPGFLQVGYYYFFSSQVRRSIVYGDQPRNRLDLYLPTDCNGSKPVVAFVTGGAWIIGYKAWGSLLGRRLAERGILVACIDYRNFPQGTISDMVKDASEGISFVCNNIASYGGNPDRIYLMGQSAGAHIASCALVHQAIKESGEGDGTSWSVSQLNAYFGLSGGYNMLNLVDHFHRRGLYRSIFLSIMEGEQSLRHFSPEIVVRNLSAKFGVPPLPPMILYHGTGDYSIPSDASTNFGEALKSIGVQAKVVLYDGKTHTDLFLQHGWIILFYLLVHKIRSKAYWVVFPAV